MSTVIEKHSFSNTPNAKEFLLLTIELHSAYQEDPIMLADTIKYLCNSFGRINKVRKQWLAKFWNDQLNILMFSLTKLMNLRWNC